MTSPNHRQPLVVAHRGLHNVTIVENTLEAFEAAVGAGAEMIELDVRRTAADELVILHDHKLGKVTLDSCSLDVFAERTGFRPPLLRDVLRWAQGTAALDVELKEDGYAHEVGQLLRDFQSAGGSLIVTSFIPELLGAISASFPEIETGLLLSFTADGGIDRAHSIGAKILLPEMKLVDEPLIASTCESGLDLIVWDYMPAKHGPQLMRDDRVRAVITDDLPGALTARS